MPTLINNGNGNDVLNQQLKLPAQNASHLELAVETDVCLFGATAVVIRMLNLDGASVSQPAAVNQMSLICYEEIIRATDTLQGDVTESSYMLHSKMIAFTDAL